MQNRREIVKGAAALAAASAFPTPGIAQAPRKISLLTWNIVDTAPIIEGWIARFRKDRPGVEVEWLDKKGPELPAFYQTQLAAGTPPDIINTQGALGLEYAGQGALMDLTDRLKGDAAYMNRFNQDYMGNWMLDGRNYMVPFYITKTVLFWNKQMFQKAGIEGPPKTFDEILAAAEKLAKGDDSGFLTLNFDWLYWPLFAMNGVDLLSKDLKQTAFNTPKAIEVADRLAKATASGAINKISWTGRWVEPNGAFAAGNVGMLHAHAPAYFYVKGNGKWVNPDTMGFTHAPGNFATPNSHGLGISKGSKNPDLAWDFLKFITAAEQNGEFARHRLLVTGATEFDKAHFAELDKKDPFVANLLRTQVEHTDRMIGNWRLGNDSRIKEAFWPEMQNIVLGRKDAKTALAEAERKVQRELRRA